MLYFPTGTEFFGFCPLEDAAVLVRHGLVLEHLISLVSEYFYCEQHVHVYTEQQHFPQPVSALH